jgi:myo-inositol-1-phosphate synthase
MNLPNEICWRVDKIGFEPPQKKWMVNFQAEINEVKKNTSLYELTGKTDFNNMTDEMREEYKQGVKDKKWKGIVEYARIKLGIEEHE